MHSSCSSDKLCAYPPCHARCPARSLQATRRPTRSAPALVIVETDAVMPPWDPPKRVPALLLRPSPARTKIRRPSHGGTHYLHKSPPTTTSRSNDCRTHLPRSCRSSIAGSPNYLRALGSEGSATMRMIVVTSDRAFPVGEQGPGGLGRSWHRRKHGPFAADIAAAWPGPCRNASTGINTAERP